MKKIEIDIMCGLPGSGKSTLAKTLYRNSSQRIWDNIDNRPIESFLDSLSSKLLFYNNHIIDGLFLDNDDYSRLIESIVVFQKAKGQDLRFKFHFFEPDIEACLWNDYGRREKSSTVTIMESKVEEPNLEILSKVYDSSKISVKKYKVIRKPAFEREFAGFKLRNKLLETVDGVRWSLGGNVRNCWDDDHEIEPEDEPCFEPCSSFRLIIDKIVPGGLPEDLMWELFKAVVSEEDYEDSDYYGGTVYYRKRVYDIRRLYELMDKKGLIVLGEMLK